MCTVVVEIPENRGGAVRLLAVRDEDPARQWDPPGEWWPDELPGVVGVRDRRAGGAWLAAMPERQRLAVILNRFSGEESWPPRQYPASRGRIVLDAANGAEPADPPLTAAFNLVSATDGGAVVTSWDGDALRRERLAPGVHMLAHHDVDDDANTARIAAWLPEFRELAGFDGDWRERWIATLERTALVAADDDRAILRDNRGYGVPTQSLLACIAEIAPGALRLDTAVLREPAAQGSDLTLSFARSI